MGNGRYNKMIKMRRGEEDDKDAHSRIDRALIVPNPKINSF